MERKYLIINKKTISTVAETATIKTLISLINNNLHSTPRIRRPEAGVCRNPSASLHPVWRKPHPPVHEATGGQGVPGERSATRRGTAKPCGGILPPSPTGVQGGVCPASAYEKRMQVHLHPFVAGVGHDPTTSGL